MAASMVCLCRISKEFRKFNAVSFIRHHRRTLSNAGNDQVDGTFKDFKIKLKSGPSLRHFIKADSSAARVADCDEIDFNHPYIKNNEVAGNGRKVYFEVFGCQMNVSDTEIAWSILQRHGYEKTDHINGADIILVMTCAIREGAETKVWNLITFLKTLKRKREHLQNRPKLKIGILGCMAERLKHKLVEKEQMVDLVAGPDSYRNLPQMLAETESGQTSVNVLLSLDETYADVMPVRLNKSSCSAFVSIMRGCDNMCSYCIVPFTRGRERSRDISSILDEVKILSDQGLKEVILLGQNVNSYRDMSESSSAEPTQLSRGFKTIYRTKLGGLRFSTLLDKVSEINPEMRVRFTSPHPKDFPDEVIHLIKERRNICNQIHLPAQSGNDRVLEIMRRGYTRQSYLDLVNHIRSIIPDIAITSDFICGFCGETEEEFIDTLTLMGEVKYNFAYMFPYSMRQKTHAFHKMSDTVPHDIKIDRLNRMIAVFRQEAEKLNRLLIGSHQLVLVEGPSKRSEKNLAGRSDQNTKVIFPNGEIPIRYGSCTSQSITPGNYVVVQVNDASSQVLKGIPLYHSTLQDFYQHGYDERIQTQAL